MDSGVSLPGLNAGPPTYELCDPGQGTQPPCLGVFTCGMKRTGPSAQGAFEGKVGRYMGNAWYMESY